MIADGGMMAEGNKEPGTGRLPSTINYPSLFQYCHFHGYIFQRAVPVILSHFGLSIYGLHAFDNLPENGVVSVKTGVSTNLAGEVDFCL